MVSQEIQSDIILDGSSITELNKIEELISIRELDGEVQVTLPQDGASFPENLAPPEFEWVGDADIWLLKFIIPDENITVLTRKNSFRPSSELWSRIKASSKNRYIDTYLYGQKDSWLGGKSFRFRISESPADGYIVYRMAGYPFNFATQKPPIYFRDISADKAELFFETTSFCFSCHSFAKDSSKMIYSTRRDTEEGRIYGVDIIYADGSEYYELIKNDSGSPWVKGSMIGSWMPDHKTVLLEINAIPKSIEYTSDRTAELYYGDVGDIGVYDVSSKKLWSLNGADKEGLREYFPEPTPDGKFVSFAIQPISEENSSINVDSDIYIIPFNDGKGGIARPFHGASEKGVREYFQRFSPDGKWMTFNRVEGEGDVFLELSDIYIIPSSGGKAKRLECNSDNMDSLASWSTNSRWIVFTSRRYKNESRLYMAEIDEDGRAYPAVKVPGQEIGERLAYHQPYFVSDGRKLIEIRKKYENFFGI
ncbi:MAG: hypothetical protein KKD39_08390 [Candidatus Altiarchaeota archaeon]|nr:hypothetical protein [Candidatus Altiarchaeota archaeon]